MAVSVFWRNPVGGVKVSRTRKEANSESPNYLWAACCKSYNHRYWWAFILICRASEDVASIQDGWPYSTVEWSQAENRQCLYSYTGVCFPQYESQEKLRHLRGLFYILPILDSITRVDVYVIFVEVVNKMASTMHDKWPNTARSCFSPTTLKWSPRSLY